MKNLFILCRLCLCLGVVEAQAQNPVVQLTSAAKPKTFEAISTYRVGRQNLSLGNLNQALQQAGYADLSNQFTVVGFQSQYGSSAGSRLVMFSQFDWTSAPSRALTTTNGTNTAKAHAIQFGLGFGYQVLRTEKFSLAPRLMVSPSFFSLTISKDNVATQSVSTLLVNPAAAEKATINSSSIGADLGVVGQYRFVYKNTTKQTDCATVSQERAFVLGMDAGYRLAPNSGFGTNAGTDGRTSVNLSGWYVGLRLGLGNRYTTKSLN